MAPLEKLKQNSAAYDLATNVGGILVNLTSCFDDVFSLTIDTSNNCQTLPFTAVSLRMILVSSNF